jgi:hypothetical protein
MANLSKAGGSEPMRAGDRLERARANRKVIVGAFAASLFHRFR